MKRVFTKTLILSSLFFALIGCGETKPVSEFEKIDGVDPTCVSCGYKDYYYSKTKEVYAEDEKGTIVITNIEDWISEGGNGYLPIDSKAHRLIEEPELPPTFVETGHLPGFTCELCHKHFTSIDGSKEILDKDWVLDKMTAIEITDGLVYLQQKSSYYDISELYVKDVDLSSFDVHGSNNQPLQWKSLSSGSELFVYFVKDGKPSYKAKGVVFRECEQLPPGMQDFLKLDDKKSADYLYTYDLDGKAVGNPAGVKLKWKNNTGECQKIVISENKDYSDPILEETLEETIINKTIYNLLPLTTYFVKVESETEEEIYKDVFRLYGHVRTMNVENVYNMRDIGGYMTESGKRVKYGKCYRSGKFDDINAKGKADIAKLGIKTDLELRFDGAETSYVEGLNYVKAGLYHWGHCFPDAVPGTPSQKSSLEGMKLAIETFANPNNYPIDIHCSGGADRTATITFVIEGLLGVSYEDMARDVELTTFSPYGLRLRAPVTLVDGFYQYDLSSDTKDKSGFVPSFQLVYNHIMNTYVESGKSFSDGIEKYLLNTIGVSKANIESIKSIFLD